jgi:hypothetical protein
MTEGTAALAVIVSGAAIGHDEQVISVLVPDGVIDGVPRQMRA